MNRKRILSLIIPVIISFSVFFGFLALQNFLEKDENVEEYSMYDGRTVRLVIGSRLLALKNPPILKDNEIALDLDTIRRYIDKTVDWDEANGKVTVTTRDRLVRMNTDNLTAFVNDRQEVKLDLPVFEEGGVVYLPLVFLSEFFQINVSYNEENNVVMVDDRRALVQVASVVEDGAEVRLGRNIKEPVVKKYPYASKSDDGISVNGAGGDGEAGTDGTDDFDMYVFEDYGEWFKVRTLDGIVGYIEKKYVSVKRYVDRIALKEQYSDAWKPDRGKIIMVWEQVASARGNPNTSDIPPMPGLDIVSPTWFSLIDDQGAVESRASTEYIDWARGNGYKVWALFSNTMNEIDMTSAFLNNSLARENAIRALLAYTAILGIDGINLDFENVYLADRDLLTQFVRELAPMLREQGLAFSVDVNVPDGSDTWSLCYDTPAIAAAADYVNLMAYDQNGARSAVSGSVSQLSWVEANLQKLIERDGVPSEKILLGIPFYTRVWEMERAGSQPGGATSGSSAVGMKTAIGGVFDNNADIEWDGESGQFFCAYTKGGKPYHVWLEDPHSANMRSSLVHKYALAGVSAWSRNFVIPEIWDVLARNLKDYVTYYEWNVEAYTESPSLEPVR